jgi:16S rRNA U1498 N3-methylase RsmE
MSRPVQNAWTPEEIADRCLIFRCLNWDGDNFRPQVRAFTEITDAARRQGATRRLPTIDELDRLNMVCKHCPNAFFEINERKCPACGSEQVASALVAISRDAVETTVIIYPYICGPCGKNLFSGKKL